MPDDVELVIAFTRACACGDLDRLRGLLAADFEMQQSRRLPWGGRYDGPDGFFDFFGRLYTHLDTRLRVEQVFDAGDVIIQTGYTEGVTRATGTPLCSRAVEVFALARGKFVRYQPFFDIAAIQAALR